MQDLKTDLRKEIEGLLQRHPSGLTAAQLAERTGSDLALTRSIIGRLRDRLLIRASRPGKSTTTYQWVTESPMKAQPSRINKMANDYIPERDNPTAPRRPGCDQHLQYGSRMGNKVFDRQGNLIEEL